MVNKMNLRLSPGLLCLLRNSEDAIRRYTALLAIASIGTFASTRVLAAANWFSFRGPAQTGFSAERGLPDKIPNKEAALWVVDFPGQSTPVIAHGKLYIMGYLGEGPDMQEGVACFDAETGKMLWHRMYNDFL